MAWWWPWHLSGDRWPSPYAVCGHTANGVHRRGARGFAGSGRPCSPRSSQAQQESDSTHGSPECPHLPVVPGRHLRPSPRTPVFPDGLVASILPFPRQPPSRCTHVPSQYDHFRPSLSPPVPLAGRIAHPPSLSPRDSKLGHLPALWAAAHGGERRPAGRPDPAADAGPAVGGHCLARSGSCWPTGRR